MKGAHVLLMRHAERTPIDTATVGNDAGLTDRGRAAARDLGRRMGCRLTHLVSSPVDRCVETAMEIGVGAGLVLPVNRSTALGDPGPFVMDPVVAWQAWLELGQAEMLRRLMAGVVQRPGFRERSEGASLVARLTRQVVDVLGPDDCGIMVTHDVVLGPVMACWFEDRAGLDVPPSPLEAAEIWAESEHLGVRWRGNVAVVRVEGV